MHQALAIDLRDSRLSTSEALQLAELMTAQVSSLHPAPCTLHPVPCTLHPARSYLFYGDGQLEVMCSFHLAVRLPTSPSQPASSLPGGSSALATLPRIGLSIELPPSYDTAAWYGLCVRERRTLSRLDLTCLDLP